METNINPQQMSEYVHRNIEILPQHGIVLMHSDNALDEPVDVMETVLFTNCVAQDLLKDDVREQKEILELIACEYNLNLQMNLSKKIAAYILLTLIQQN